MPPLQKQNVAIPVLGLDTHADPKSAPPGTLDLADNIWFKRTAGGGAEVRKRFGCTQRSKNIIGGGTISNGAKLTSFNNEQLLDDGSGLYSWSATTGQWARAGGAGFNTLPGVNITVDTLDFMDGIPTVDVAVGGGLICAVFCGGQGGPGAASAVILDATTGSRVAAFSTLGFSGTASVIKVIALNSVFMLVSSATGSGNLASATIAYANPSVVSGVVNVSTILATGVFSGKWDMIRSGPALDSVLVALRTTTPNTTITVWNANQTSGGSVTNANVPDFGLSWLAWDFSDSRQYLSYVSSAGGGLKTHTVNPTGPAITATTVNDAAVVTGLGMTGFRLAGANNIFVVQSVAANTKTDFIQLSTGGAVSTWLRGHSLSAKCFIRAGKAYLGVLHDNFSDSTPAPGSISVDQRANFIIDCSSGNFPIVVAKCLFGKSGQAITGEITNVPRTLPQIAALDADHFLVPMRRSSIGSAGGASINFAALGRVDFSRVGLGKPAQIGDAIYFPSGNPRIYDGVDMSEAGFHTFPSFSGTSPSQSAGGGLTLLGTYGYTYLWRETDSKGQVHRSAPAPPEFFTLTAANNRAVFTMQTYRLTEKFFSNVVLEVYLTAANGAVFYLIGFVANNKAVDTVTFDTTAITDATTQVGVQLYTTGAELPHGPWPPAKLMVSWNNRLFMSGTENPTELWISDERVIGEGIGFSDANMIAMETEGGSISAIAEMDDRLIIGKSSGNNESLYELTGRGPAPTGEGNFEQPARITANVGPTTPDAVVKTPQGLMFKSRKGFHLLPVGGGTPVRLRGVEDFEVQPFTGAVVLEDRELVLVTASSGTTLVYHYGFQDERGIGRWTTWTNQFAVDCAVWAGAFVFLRAGGDVREETTLFSDNGSSIIVQMEWTWFSPAGVFGSTRVYEFQLLCEFMGSFTMTGQVFYNYEPFVGDPPQTKAVTTATKSALKLTPTYGRAQAFRLFLSEDSTTEGFRLSALGLEVGVRPGMYKRPVASRMT